MKILNEENEPVEGVKVTLHSTIQEAITNKDGIAVFENVVAGNHKVVLNYNGFKSEQELSLIGDTKEFFFEIKVKEQNAVSGPTYMWGIGILVAVIIIIILIIRKRHSVN